MNEKLEGLLRIYRANERHYMTTRERTPPWVLEEMVILFGMMEEHIPDSHIDEINLLVYGISRRT